MRVLHVMGRFSASGTERQLAAMMVAAVNNELWEPALCLLRPSPGLADTLPALGVELFRMPARGDFNPLRGIDLRRAVRTFEPDVIHSSLWGANAVTRLSLMGPNRPTVVISERRVEDFRKTRHGIIDRALRSVTDGYIGNSSAVADFIAREHGVARDEVSVITNGIDRSVFHPAPMERAGPQSTLRVGSVGRLVMEKGYATLIEAMRLLRTDIAAECLVAGSGPELATLEGLAGSPPLVRFIGELNTPCSVADFMRGLDIFVLPSSAEGLPNVVLEAQACGVPVVVTDAPGMREAAPDATLVPAGDPVALAAAIHDAALAWKPPRELRISSHLESARQHYLAFELALSDRSARRQA